MREIVYDIPLIALRGMTILPYMVIHFDVSRKKSIKSVEYAMKNGQQLFLATQKSVDVMEPKAEDIYEYGTVGEIKQLVKMPGGVVRVLIKGLYRAALVDFAEREEMLVTNVEKTPQEEELLSDVDKEARLELLKELMKRYYEVTERNQGETLTRIRSTTSLDELIYKAAADCTTDFVQRQQLLDTDDILARFDLVCGMIYQQIEVSDIKKELAFSIKSKIDQNQKEYVMREQMQLLRNELGENDSESEIEEFKKKTDALKAPEEVKAKLHREIKRYASIPEHASESYVIRSYIETLLELPWGEYSEDNHDIVNAEKILEEDHYGLKKVKERIVEFLAVRALTGKGEQPILCLVGPPGTGKTSIAASVAKALNRKYVRICLGGVRDEAEIRGHRKTYVGAMPGRIVEGLRQAGTGNPLMLLDEIDKVGNDQRGDTASALLEILDSAQNNAFRDHYVEVPIDLSQVLFIATANDTATIPKPLLDRMDVVEINTYTQVEKHHIATEHLIPKQLAKNGLTASQITFTKEAVDEMIESYTKESGVRELERMIAAVCRKAAKAVLAGEKAKHRITAANLKKYLGAVKYEKEEALKKDAVGIVRGLAWTSVGGTTLDVEACLMEGKGEITLTGQMGDVMKESAMVALGYIRSRADHYKIEKELFENRDIHIHIPEGAVPKDGPSAGITMTLAMLSAYTNRKVAHEYAMTGEITLHGQVLPIGGLQEKLLAAKTTGAKTVLVPGRNKKDVAEIDPEILDGLNITYVQKMDDVVKAALR